MNRTVVWVAVGAVIIVQSLLLWSGEYFLVAECCAGFLLGYFWPKRRASRD